MSSGSGAGPAPGGTGPYLLDSSVLIRSLRGDAAIRALIGAATVYVPSVALGEIYYGAYGSATRASADLHEVDALAATLAVLVADTTTAMVYGRIKREQRAKGQMLPGNDFWIAAIAIQYDLVLAARDAHFAWIGGLKYEQW